MALSTTFLRLREHRERLGLTQAEMAERLVQMAWARERVHVGVNADMVSKWERGLKHPSKLYQRLLCLTFDASPSELGLVLGAGNDAATPTGLLTAHGLLPATAPGFAAGAVDPEVMTHVRAMFTQLVAMDAAVGPRLVVGAAEHQASLLERLSLTGTGRVQRDLQATAARFAELAGWLYQDLGDLEQARRWSERAMDFAVVHGERRLVTYMLMRRSMVAAERGDASSARSFAEAALPDRHQAPPRLAAVSLRAAAVAYSLSGDAAACARALGDAQETLESSDPTEPSDDDLTGYCTPAYLGMEAAGCWLTLSQPRKAIAALEIALDAWPGGQDRDRSLALSRLATAYAEIGNIESTCAAADQARELVVVAGSARTIATLTSLAMRLAPHTRQERVAALRRSLAAL